MAGFAWEITDSPDDVVLESIAEEYDDIHLFGKYELGKQLGHGAFGKVYQALDLRTRRTVAVKAVSKRKAVANGFTENVKREISVMRRLRHPNVVNLLEVLSTPSSVYFVMEFVGGGDIVSKVRNRRRLSEHLGRRYFRQLISAVKYCHDNGVFHRDLKFENLLLDENDNLKISDFGLCAAKDQVRPDERLHTVCGSPSYVAPEVLARKGYDGAKVDVWSCGVVLYGLTAGYLPFKDKNLAALFRKIRNGEFRCPKWMSPDLKRLLHRILDTNPDTRITVEEILQDPWFVKDPEETKIRSDGLDSRDHDVKCLNAFDIISLSPGFDLSGLFRNSDISAQEERFITGESPETIMQRVEEVATAEGITVVKRGKWGVKLEGQDGNFVIVIEIYRLTEKLVMVEVRLNRGTGQGVWEHQLRPRLNCLVCQPETTGSSN